MAREELDLIIIGSGPGGYVAAIRAAQLGLKTAVVEKDPQYGGTCGLRGCIPTKALLHTAAVLDEIKESAALGISVPEPTLDMVKAQERKQKVVDSNAKGVEFLFKKNKVTGLRGRGRLTGPHEVTVEGPDGEARYGARFVLIATGSVPRDIPMAPSDGERVLTSDHVLELKSLPASLAVLGAGAVGTEFASIYNSFGSKVTLVEMLPRVLPIEDEEISAELEKLLRRHGIKVMAGTRMTGFEKTGNGVRLQLEKGEKSETLEAEKLLVAVGRRPVTENLGLEALGVELERGFVKVNPTLQSTLSHIYAIGDVINTAALAHVASAEGILAVEHMAGKPVKPLNYDRVPSCTYCDPEVASVGLSEAKAKERGYDVMTGKFPLTALGKARIIGKTEGFVKVVREKKYDELLGVHIIGAHATDLIAEACVALRLEGTNEELMHTMHAHPTLPEALAEAAHIAAGQPLHV